MNHTKGEKFPDIGTVVDSFPKLPSLPLIVMEILDSINDKATNVSVLAQKISSDQAIVARVLRVANSPFYGLSCKVDSISRAVTLLGFNNLRGLIMASAVINAFPCTEKTTDWLSFWQHNICTAACAKVLAKHTGQNSEAAFTAGILHDIGKLIIALNFPRSFYGEGLGKNTLQAEQDNLGFDHAVLGGEIAKRWHFPHPIQRAIEFHHEVNRTHEEIDLTDVVYIANLFARTLQTTSLTQDEKVQNLTDIITETRIELKGEIPDVVTEMQQFYESTLMLIT